MARISLIDSKDQLAEAEQAIYAETLQMPGVRSRSPDPSV
jgi:hypothetical protein